jgi:hypothetical protein
MSEDLEDHQTSQATPGEVIVDPSVDAPATRSWMMLDNVSSAPKFRVVNISSQPQVSTANNTSSSQLRHYTTMPSLVRIASPHCPSEQPRIRSV